MPSRFASWFMRSTNAASDPETSSASAIDASVGADNKFTGDGTYERKDHFTTRVAATVIDVK